MRFDGRVAIVTGAASGIGLATAQRLSDEGATVVRVDIAKDGLDDDAISGDVSDPSFASLLVAQTLERHARLDVLALIAGVVRTAKPHDQPIEPLDHGRAENRRATLQSS